jgi:hypothetical protein
MKPTCCSDRLSALLFPVHVGWFRPQQPSCPSALLLPARMLLPPAEAAGPAGDFRRTLPKGPKRTPLSQCV